MAFLRVILVGPSALFALIFCGFSLAPRSFNIMLTPEMTLPKSGHCETFTAFNYFIRSKNPDVNLKCLVCQSFFEILSSLTV